MRYLYDANLITALTHRDQSDHQRAVAWLRSKSNPPLATCDSKLRQLSPDRNAVELVSHL